jgi:hypothetical protein
MAKCEWCGGEASFKQNGRWFCSNGCVDQFRTKAKYSGKSGILSGLGQMSDAVLGGHGASADNLLGGAGKVVGGLGKLAIKGLFKKK